jgi:hypothetical protein
MRYDMNSPIFYWGKRFSDKFDLSDCKKIRVNLPNAESNKGAHRLENETVDLIRWVNELAP